jgi:hypothetical protein
MTLAKVTYVIVQFIRTFVFEIWRITNLYAPVVLAQPFGRSALCTERTKPMVLSHSDNDQERGSNEWEFPRSHTDRVNAAQRAAYLVTCSPDCYQSEIESSC